jgi:hypothetical protein
VIWYASCHAPHAENKVIAVGRHFDQTDDRPLRSAESHRFPFESQRQFGIPQYKSNRTKNLNPNA